MVFPQEVPLSKLKKKKLSRHALKAIFTRNKYLYNYAALSPSKILKLIIMGLKFGDFI